MGNSSMPSPAPVFLPPPPPPSPYDIPAAFSFRVEIRDFDTDSNFSFRDVSGLTVKMEWEKVNEGGQNDYTYKFPKRTVYNDLVLKRGILKGSQLIKWITDAVRNFNFKPVNMLVHLVDGDEAVIISWSINGAIPVGVETAEFKALENALAIETLTLTYNYFERIETPPAK